MFAGNSSLTHNSMKKTRLFFFSRRQTTRVRVLRYGRMNDLDLTLTLADSMTLLLKFNRGFMKMYRRQCIQKNTTHRHASCSRDLDLWPVTLSYALNLQGGPTKTIPLLYALTSSNINRFSKWFHCQNQEKICSNAITKDPATSEVCRYTTLWNVTE